LIFLASVMWIPLCIIAIFLSAAARREPRFYSTEDGISRSLGLWIASMFILDLAVFTVGVTVGYNPSFYPCMMLLLIQWAYIQSAIVAYTKLKTEGDQFDDTNARNRLRGAPLGTITLSTFLLAISLEIISLDETLPLLLVFFGTAIFFSGLDFLFLRFLEFKQSQ
jgi:hypothetical protein